MNGFKLFFGGSGLLGVGIYFTSRESVLPLLLIGVSALGMAITEMRKAHGN